MKFISYPNIQQLHTLSYTCFKNTIVLLFISFSLTSCYTYQWKTQKNVEQSAAPSAIKDYFDQYQNEVRISGISPNATYHYDAWEKDVTFANPEHAFAFNSVTLSLQPTMPKGQIQVMLQFKDSMGNTVRFKDFDLLRIIPTLNTTGDHLYPELLLEEFNRFGVSFRKEFHEFQITKSAKNAQEYNDALDRVYRANIVNGCLDPGKWELTLISEDYSDFPKRIKDSINYNQNKILAHSWYLFPKDLYRLLMQYKNPGVTLPNVDFANFDYKELSQRAAEVNIDFKKLRNPIKKKWEVTLLNVGHKNNTPIQLLDMEEHYKINYGLFIDHDETRMASETYTSILDPKNQPLQFAQFRDEGFYDPNHKLSFDVNWLSHLDQVTIESIDLPETECLVQIQVKGQWSPYMITLGNIDLSTIEEQKLYGLHFGFNVYPKNRRYNPKQPTITFDEDLMPKSYQRYVVLTDCKTGKWVDNFHKGLGKIFLSFDTLEKDILHIYLVSYERIVPLWMASVKIPKELRERARIRKQLYTY